MFRTLVAILILFCSLAAAGSWKFVGSSVAAYSNTKSTLFAGGTNVIDMGNVNDITGSAPVSWTVWVKVTAVTMTMFAKGRISTPGYIYFLSGGFPQIIMDNGVQRLRAQATTQVTAGTWTCLALTYDGSRSTSGLHFYINGSADTFSTITNTLASTISNSASFFVGNDGQGDSTTGNIDEPAMYIGTELTSGNVSTVCGGAHAINMAGFAGLTWWLRMGDSPDTTSTYFDRVGSSNGTPSFSGIVTAAP